MHQLLFRRPGSVVLLYFLSKSSDLCLSSECELLQPPAARIARSHLREIALKYSALLKEFHGVVNLASCSQLAYVRRSSLQHVHGANALHQALSQHLEPLRKLRSVSNPFRCGADRTFSSLLDLWRLLDCCLQAVSGILKFGNLLIDH